MSECSHIVLYIVQCRRGERVQTIECRFSERVYTHRWRKPRRRSPACFFAVFSLTASFADA
jgi:hypothetical protein